MKVAVVTFPGSNCDHDCLHAVTHLGHEAVSLWHGDEKLPQHIDAVIIPGGFSYGDYLRCGAIARFSPVMKAVKEFSERGGKVIGICNGFQILTEAGLLPGVLLKNKSLKFICKPVQLRLENTRTPFTWKGAKGQILKMPIAHGEGNYYADDKTLAELESKNQIVFRYEGENPNGACRNIAGICNERGNVLGMMPHPERVIEKSLGGEDGLVIFASLLGEEAR